MKKDDVFILPIAVATKRQLVRLINELEEADQALTSKSIRRTVKAADKTDINVPSLVQELFALNSLKVTNGAHRSKALAQLRSLRKSAPITHLTFAADADEASLQQIAEWLRETVDPRMILEVGLQPGLVAGVYVRAQNRIFDYSLRSKLEDQRGILMAALGVDRAAK